MVIKNIYVVQKSIESREFQIKIKVITRYNQLVSKFSAPIQHVGREKAWNSMHTYVIKGKHFFPNATININWHGQKEDKD